MNVKKKSEKEKDSEKFFREKLEEKLDNLRNMILGRNTPLKDYILTEKGSFSETKTRKFISSLMDHIREYRFLNEITNMAFDERITLLFSDMDEEKKIKIFSKATTEMYEAEDIFFENFFYCVIRILFLDGPDDSATFSSIAEAAGDLYYVYNDKDILDDESMSDELVVDIFNEMMFLDEYDLNPGSSVKERHLYALKSFCTGRKNILKKINNLYFILTYTSPKDHDITDYEKTDPQHFKLLEKRKDHLENEAYAHEKRINRYRPKVDDPYEGEPVIPDEIEIDEYELYELDRLNDEYLEEKKTVDQALPDFRKKFRESDKFIKACELFRYYLNTGKTREFKEEHKNDPSIGDLPGYDYYKEKIEYALDSFISDMNLSILSDKDTCVYIYTLLGQAEKMVEKKTGGE